MRFVFGWALAITACSVSACASDDGARRPAPANLTVRQRIASLAPVVFAHRGLGPTRAGNAFPENSLMSFRAAVDQGADALEMDSELTLDGQLVVMHDDTVDRTTECSGCVSALSLAEIRRCRLLDGDGRPTGEVPPTLDEVFALEPRDMLVNVELKVFGSGCLTPNHGPAQLAAAMVSALRRLRAEHRTIVQSFNAAALMAVNAQAPEIYTALLVTGLRTPNIATALEVQADALQPGGPFPLQRLSPDLLRSAREAGLQVIPWTVNDVASVNDLLDSHVEGIITDDPALVKQVIRSRADS